MLCLSLQVLKYVLQMLELNAKPLLPIPEVLHLVFRDIAENSDSIAAAVGIYAPLSPLLKRKKPKNNIAKTNSSFVSRIITHDNFQKRLSERKNDDVYAFVNVSRAYEWLDLTTSEKVSRTSCVTNLRLYHLQNYSLQKHILRVMISIRIRVHTITSKSSSDSQREISFGLNVSLKNTCVSINR